MPVLPHCGYFLFVSISLGPSREPSFSFATDFNADDGIATATARHTHLEMNERLANPFSVQILDRLLHVHHIVPQAFVCPKSLSNPAWGALDTDPVILSSVMKAMDRRSATNVMFELASRDAC